MYNDCKDLDYKEGGLWRIIKVEEKGESFSDLLLRLARKARNIDILEDIAGTVDWKDKDKLINEIHSRRFEKRWLF